MKRHLAAIIAVVMAFALALPVMANPFADVPENHWAYEAVKRLAASGIVEGFPDGTFKGAEGMTRYQMAMVVARMLSDLDAQIRDAVQQAKDEATIQGVDQREEINKAIDEAKMQAVEMSRAAAEEIAKSAATEAAKHAAEQAAKAAAEEAARAAAEQAAQGAAEQATRAAEEAIKAHEVAEAQAKAEAQAQAQAQAPAAQGQQEQAPAAPPEKIIERVVVEKPIIEKIIEKHIVEKEGSVDKATLDARVAEAIAIVEALKAEFAQELNVLGVRVTALEEQLALASAKIEDVNQATTQLGSKLAQTASRLEGHIAGHERVRISGDSKVSFKDVDIHGDGIPWLDPFNPKNNNQPDDESEPRNENNPDFVFVPTSEFNHELNLKLTANVADGVVAEAGLATMTNILGGGWDNNAFQLKDNGLYLDVVTTGILRHMRIGNVAEPAGTFTNLTLQGHMLRDSDGIPLYEGVLTEMAYGRLNATGLVWRLQAPVLAGGKDSNGEDIPAAYARYAAAIDAKLSLTDNLIVGATYVAAFDDEKSLANGPAEVNRDSVAGVNAKAAFAPGWGASAEFARHTDENGAQHTATEMSLDGCIGPVQVGAAYTRVEADYHPEFVEVPYDSTAKRGLDNNVKTASVEASLPLAMAGGELTLTGGYEKTGNANWAPEGGEEGKDVVATKSIGAEFARNLLGADVVAGVNLALAHRDSAKENPIVNSLKIGRSISAKYAPLSVEYAVTDTRDVDAKAAVSRERVLDLGFAHDLTPEIALRGGYKSYKMNAEDPRSTAVDEEYTVKTAGVDLGFSLTTATKLTGSWEYRRVDYSDTTPWDGLAKPAEIEGAKTAAKAGIESQITPNTKVTGEVGITSGAVKDPGVDGRMLTGEIGLAHHIAENTDLELGYKAMSYSAKDDPGDDYRSNVATASLVVKF
ncbi:MAG: S-layer homology domain-containing protein [Bacillota bacterium]|nr:S-layer homology domain-containing protein [Bacillota bacterium]